MIYDRATTALVRCFILEGVAFEEARLLMFVLLLQRINHCSMTYIFVVLIFWLCTSILPLEHWVVAEAESNWYLHDINIYSLQKN
jgi:hypothetical protein